jgi:hypothetical protein
MIDQNLLGSDQLLYSCAAGFRKMGNQELIQTHAGSVGGCGN